MFAVVRVLLISKSRFAGIATLPSSVPSTSTVVLIKISKSDARSFNWLP